MGMDMCITARVHAGPGFSDRVIDMKACQHTSHFCLQALTVRCCGTSACTVVVLLDFIKAGSPEQIANVDGLLRMPDLSRPAPSSQNAQALLALELVKRGLKRQALPGKAWGGRSKQGSCHQALEIALNWAGGPCSGPATFWNVMHL